MAAALFGGCQLNQLEVAPQFNSEVVEINVAELANYWVPSDTKIKMLKRRPKWFPKGSGEWTVLTVIDSNGIEVAKP
ncbi:hypothetical protein [Shewanella sp. Isolate11]|uniref:hypothetical protein n=1 Tax=Shewanella sp. Isolate11 TaxID=2908530 RepID=UPI001EFDB6CB|nr:hypothetical protein [Shewanella sp. Isolate11]MCG9696727.1 hypothetical protein [Shewanella sp. Isolate11]